MKDFLKFLGTYTWMDAIVSIILIIGSIFSAVFGDMIIVLFDAVLLIFIALGVAQRNILNDAHTIIEGLLKNDRGRALTNMELLKENADLKRRLGHSQNL